MNWWTPALSIVAILVSLGALWQTRRWRPRPLMQIEASEVGGNHEFSDPFLRVMIANRGNADAVDVRAVVVSRSGRQMEPRETIGTMKVDKPLSRLFRLDWPGRDVKVPVDYSDYVLRVTWRQAPNVEKERELLFEVSTATPIG